LGAGSVQRLKALIKRNPKDYTISHPIMDVRLFNLDFDGDECPISLVLDDVMREQTEILKPHYAYLKVSVYGQVSNAFDMPKPIAAMVHNYFKDQVDEPMDSEVLSLLQH
jgi:hypothetical protein